MRVGVPLDLPPSERTLPALLDRQATANGDAVLVRTEACVRTFREQRDLAAAWAGRLTAEGLAAGDTIAIMSENRAEVIDLWLGAAWLGAVAVPVNTAARGLQLGHVLRDSGAKILVLAAELVAALEHVEEELDALERVWVLDGGAHDWRRKQLEAIPGPGSPRSPHAVRPGDTAAILYTSGTTGPPKGVLCPHAQWYWWGVRTGALLDVGPDDVLYTCLPLFHTNALNTFVQALLAGARFVPGPRFSASRFWQRLAESEATVTYLLGAMAHILAKRPDGPHDREHGVRVALAPATAADLYPVFRDRFGIEIVDGWGSTETNVVIATAGTDAPPGSMGAVVEGFEARVVDGDDVEVGPNTPGELVVRASEPFSFANGYHGLPADTVRAWRNLWFHTGDRVVRDDDGWFWFVDRIKDSIRRRGENISSYEVEAALTSHPDVAAAAAVPVPAEVGEDEVLVFVVLRDGARGATYEALIRHCEPRLAYFAIPRYLEFVDELPLTANGKVEKYRLRARGIGAETWDREAAGVALRRE